MNTLQVGDTLPFFSVEDQYGNAIKHTDYANQKLVVFFYPKANTPGCTLEACDLRDHYAKLQAAGYALLGVSADSIKRQKSFSDKFNFPFPLLADEDKGVIEAFGVWGPKKFQGKEYDGIHRKTFLFNEEGVCTRVIDKVKTKEHAAQILEV